ncbi:MAG: VWA domain-containing protein, partial [Planctomycetota bacterium]
GAVRTRRSVESLITRIGDERGAARTFLADALVDLTGVDHGDAPDGWQKWWGIVGASFEVPPRVAKKAGDAPERPRTVASYYGIPLRTDSMVFIIDLSGSMTAKVGDKTKLRAAQDQLIAVLRKLQPTQKFGLIGFGTDVGAWEPALVPASPKNVDEAVAWVERLAIRGSTNIYDSLERALAFEGVESIFLLSDGGPSAGRFVAMDQIRAAVRVQNRDQRVRINTILIGGSAREQDFMRKLAGENDGEVGRPDADRGTR